MKTTLFLLLASTLFFSCGNKSKDLSEKTVRLMFNGISMDATDSILKAYPDFENVRTHYKSDSIIIIDISNGDDDKMVVKVKNHFTNGYGKKFNQDIILFLKPENKEASSYIIFDSKGLMSYDEDDVYKFAVKTGCVTKGDVTDQQIAEKLKAANDMLTVYALKLYSELISKITFTSWDWESGYGDSASGKGILKNNSDYNIPKPKYKITYKDRDGKEITTDGGYVTYDTLEAGSSKAFTFYTSYVGNASRASISIDFDTELLVKYVSNDDYTGSEYEEFINKKESSKDKIS